MTQRIALLIFGDIFFAVVALYSALLVVVHQKSRTPLISDIVIFASVLLFSSYFLELYNRNKIYSFIAKERLAAICLNLIMAFIALSTILFLAPSELLGRRMLIISLSIFGVMQLIWHYAYVAFLNDASMAQKVLILGKGNLARIMERIILLKQTNYVFSGYYDLSLKHAETSDASLKATCSGLMEYARKEKVDKLIVAMTERRGTFPLQELLNCKFTGIEIVDAPSFYEEIMGKLLIENITPGWFIFSDGFKLDSTRKLIKRIIDIFCALIGIILSLPLIPFIALLIRIDSKGPLFYRQIRVGEMEKNFSLIKFRTMRQDAECNTGAVWAQKNDCRVTRVGKILRKLRLDELPQFINVLKGDMSLIGPRPERPQFVEKLKQTIPYYGNRHFVKPGITGWAQIKYPYGASEEDALEKLRYDLYYIKNLSLLLDMSIIIETIKVVLFGRGAR